MNRNTCPYFDTCSAPLCPMDESISHYTWFPDEAVCRRNGMPDWIRRQRRIARKVDFQFERGSFTHRMLSVDFMVTKGLRGIEPDKGPAGEQEERWLKKHQPITAELRARGRKLAALSRAISESEGPLKGDSGGADPKAESGAGGAR